LHVLGARVELLSQNARRVMNLDEFILGPGKTALRPREILTRILVPPTRHFQVQHFEKVGQRKAMAIAVVSLASLFRLGPRGLIEKARLALGSVGPTIIRPAEAEASLIGRKLSPAALAQAARLVRKAIRPIDDIRASAEYRRQTAGNLVMRLAENEYAKNFKKTDKLLCN
ncbi:MAG: xanthine dehydrogenase family protein subunit M, partial [Deltaproteobacteria bacterium]|nr:xanthine dehydrogenase family protein subunit M [Deltaproteobacteria bacterium]